ncbi:DUF2059 domain-containing protein [Endozoicomonas sp. SCSIO W0465]|uniref:DUF2059 domain-containing protein n=1 Tax=Endozoicomonas sp. SCSIO W0465 TaxID=2918516 RepID=UPI002074C1DA|nr:DUF2059 domain-containing protein [Endozoicomonas sp. SCSIO W0465]USE35334.1 DUF2059 domain-containing protein [Endozoicomonas sp. SCSIO W0465]
MDGKRLVVACLFASLLFVANAQASPAKHQLLDLLYDQAGLERQLVWIHDSMTLQEQTYPIPEPVLDTVNQVVKIRYSPDFFRASMKVTLDEALSVGELDRLIDWFGSPLGKEILRLEAEANDPVNQAQMEAYIREKLSAEQPRNSRITLIEALMEALDAVELSTELAASASVGAQRILREVMPAGAEQPMRPAQVLKAQEKLYIRKDMLERMRNVFLYTYRTLPDSDLKRYLKFARERAMQNFQRGQIQAISRML